MLENIDAESNRDKDFRIEELNFKIENCSQKFEELTKKLQTLKDEISQERDKLIPKVKRSCKTTELLQKPRMDKNIDVYETEELVPVTEIDRFNVKNENFHEQLEKDLNSLKKRYDECLHSNKLIKEEIDTIRKEKSTFDTLHRT